MLLPALFGLDAVNILRNCDGLADYGRSRDMLVCRGSSALKNLSNHMLGRSKIGLSGRVAISSASIVLLPFEPLFPPPRWRACENRKRKKKKRKEEMRNKETILQKREKKDHPPQASAHSNDSVGIVIGEVRTKMGSKG